MTIEELLETFKINLDHIPVSQKEILGVLDTFYLLFTEEQAHEMIHLFFQHADEIYNMGKSSGNNQ